MKYIKTYEKQLAYKLSDFVYNNNDIQIQPKFSIGDYVYADPNMEQNGSMKNIKLQIIRVLPSGYVVVDRYPNFALAVDRLISEVEYDENKYNL